jgi:hypothetical protein
MSFDNIKARGGVATVSVRVFVRLGGPHGCQRREDPQPAEAPYPGRRQRAPPLSR